jgi:dienelactone hydrolase
MKKIILALFVAIFYSCSKSEDKPAETLTPPSTPAANVTNTSTTTNGFMYKTYFQMPANATNRKGIVVLAHGDGGNSNDAILNDQCVALANEGYVAVTTSYRALTGTFNTNVNNFKADMESVINQLVAAFNIPVNKTLLGGSSRGGNLSFSMFLPADPGPIQPTTLNLRGVILQCSGGDTWKGANILKPVIFMSNKTDATVGTDALAFKAGLTNNSNVGVSSLSECFIVDSEGHCTNPELYKPFLVRKVKEFLP